MFRLTEEEWEKINCNLLSLSQFNNELVLQIEVINDALDQLREKKEEPDNPIGFRVK